MNTFKLCVFFLLVLRRFASCTDIAAVYKHSVLLIKNADTISESQQISWESAKLNLPEPLAYPVGIASDQKNGRIFVADAMNIENSLFTVQMFSNGSVEAMYPLLKKTHIKDIRVIEDIFYDGRTSQLYWTDSFRNSLDKAHVPENPQDMITERPKPVHNFGNVKKPRGVALDYCNNLLYWSEINETARQIEVCDLNGKYQGAVRTASDNENKYFMGITFDISSGAVIWGEMEGKELGAPCRILSSEFGGSSDQEAVITQLAELDNCYPFELTSDEEYIYWADWSRNGIMRLSKTNPNEIVKIVDAPKVVSDEGTHHGVFGLTLLGGPSFQEIEKTCSHQKVKDFPDLQQSEQSLEAERSVDPPLEIVTKSSEKISSDIPKITKELETRTSTEAQQNQLKEQPVTEVLSKPQEKFLVQPFNSQKTIEAQREAEEPSQERQDKENQSAMNGGLDKTFVESEDYQSSQTAADEKIELCSSSVFHEQNLMQVVIGLGVGCIVFLSTTIILTIKLCLIKYPGYNHTKLSNDDQEDPSGMEKNIVRKPHKRFGPKKNKNIQQDLCSGIPSDGVSINIEDCCQMTLCDTPCYTSVKREGCSYKKGAKSEDKRSLLDDTSLNI